MTSLTRLDTLTFHYRSVTVGESRHVRSSLLARRVGDPRPFPNIVTVTPNLDFTNQRNEGDQDKQLENAPKGRG